MAFFEKLRRAFGFDDSADYDDEIGGIDATVTPLRQRREENCSGITSDGVACDSDIKADARDTDADANSAAMMSAEEKGASQASIDETAASVCTEKTQDGYTATEGAVPAEIFRTVVAIFNRSLPDFLESSVDTSRQEQYLYNALEKGMKGYLDSLEVQARRRYQELRQSDMLKVENELKQLREGLRQKEEDSTEARKLQLSAERQKRALTERVHDLEKQIATMEADAEQLDLENKSLVNKLRLSAIQENDLENAKAEDAERSATIEKLRGENKELADALEQMQLKQTLGETMVNDLQSRASEALKTAADREQALGTLSAEFGRFKSESQLEVSALKLDLDSAVLRASNAEQALAKASDTSEELRQQVDELTIARDEALSQVETLSSQLSKTREKLAVVSEIQTQVEQLEEARLKADAVIRRHKDEIMEKDELLRHKDSDLRDKNMSLAQKDAMIKRLEDLTDSLRRQLEDAAYERSQSESALRGEISRLKSLDVSSAAVAEPTAQYGAKAKTETETGTPSAAVPAVVDSIQDTAGAIDYLLDDLPIIEKADGSASRAVKKTRKRSDKENRKKSAKETIGTPADAVFPSVEKEGDTAVKLAISVKDPGLVDGFDSLDSDDWLVSTPAPKKKQSRRAEMADNDDFGYHEPQRNTQSDNPAQMSLF